MPRFESGLLALRVGGSTLWFDEQANNGGYARNTICVTGTKGKSTTTALLAHLLRAAGKRTVLAGNIGLPMLGSLDVSNRLQIGLALDRIAATGCRKIGLLGLAFKAGTDDLRESPAVELAERLIGKGYELKIMDRHVQEARLIGANRSYIEEKIPHLSALLADADEIVDHAELLVICNTTAEFRNVVGSSPKAVRVLDLVGLFKTSPEGVNYDGISW